MVGEDPAKASYPRWGATPQGLGWVSLSLCSLIHKVGVKSAQPSGPSQCVKALYLIAQESSKGPGAQRPGLKAASVIVSS